MSVKFNVLDENFEVLHERYDACFSDLYKLKGVYISFYPAMTGDFEDKPETWRFIPETPEIEQFSLDMFDLWKDFLVNTDSNWDEHTQVVMDMRKYSYNCILSVMSSFRYINEEMDSVQLYCTLRNKYKLSVLQALAFCTSAIRSNNPSHTLMPGVAFSGTDFIKRVLKFNWESVLEKLKGEPPIDWEYWKNSSIFRTWGNFPQDYYNIGDHSEVLFSFLDKEIRDGAEAKDSLCNGI